MSPSEQAVEAALIEYNKWRDNKVYKASEGRLVRLMLEAAYALDLVVPPEPPGTQSFTLDEMCWRAINVIETLGADAALAADEYDTVLRMLAAVRSGAANAQEKEQASEGVNAPSSPAGALDASGAASPASLAGDATGQEKPQSDFAFAKDMLKRAGAAEARHHEAVGLLKEALVTVEHDDGCQFSFAKKGGVVGCHCIRERIRKFLSTLAGEEQT